MIKKLYENKAKAYASAQGHFAIMNDAGASDADKATARAAWDAAMAEVDRIAAQIADTERMNAAEASQNAIIDANAQTRGVSQDEAAARASDEERVFRNYLVGGVQNMNDADRQIFNEMRANMPQNAQSTTAAEGGITIPTTTQAQIETAMAAFGGLRSVATILRTASGEPIIMPTANDTARKGRILTEGATAPQGAGAPFANLTLGAYMYTSDVEPISFQLIMDSQVNIQGYMGERLGERLGRITSEHYATGTGTGQPRGIMTAATVGRMALSTTAITYADLIELEHAVDPAYRASAGYLISDALLKQLRLLEDADGRPLWQPSLSAGAPGLLNGRPYTVDMGLAPPAAGAKVAAFGQLNKYHIRDVANMMLMVNRDKYSESAQVGVFAFMRTDGNLLDAGTAAVRTLQMAAS